jgi:hypothetical protein
MGQGIISTCTSEPGVNISGVQNTIWHGSYWKSSDIMHTTDLAKYKELNNHIKTLSYIP